MFPVPLCGAVFVPLCLWVIVSVRLCVFVCLYVCMFVCMFACVFACVVVCASVSLCVCLLVVGFATRARAWRLLSLRQPAALRCPALQWGAEKKNQVLWFGDRYVGAPRRVLEYSSAGAPPKYTPSTLVCPSLPPGTVAALFAKHVPLQETHRALRNSHPYRESADPYSRKRGPLFAKARALIRETAGPYS